MYRQIMTNQLFLEGPFSIAVKLPEVSLWFNIEKSHDLGRQSTHLVFFPHRTVSLPQGNRRVMVNIWLIQYGSQ